MFPVRRARNSSGVRLHREFTAEVVQDKIRKVAERIQNLEDQKADLTDAIEAKQVELDILSSLAKQSAGKAGATGKPAALADLAAGTKVVGQRIAELKAGSRRDARAQRKIEKDLKALRAELKRLGSGTRERKTAEVDLEVAQAGPVRFELSYMVTGAGWAPLYDLRLDADSAKPEMAMSHAAQVRQSSGEDWENVTLTLSTARPTQVTQVPPKNP